MVYIEMSMRNGLILTNTQFYHEMAHRTTWVCPERKEDHQDRHGNIRRNPYKNQIAYTLIRKEHGFGIQDLKVQRTQTAMMAMTKLGIDRKNVYGQKNNTDVINTEWLVAEETVGRENKEKSKSYIKNSWNWIVI